MWHLQSWTAERTLRFNWHNKLVLNSELLEITMVTIKILWFVRHFHQMPYQSKIIVYLEHTH